MKVFKIRKNYFRVGNPAKTNIIYRKGAITFNFSHAWEIKLFKCNAKTFYLNALKSI